MNHTNSPPRSTIIGLGHLPTCAPGNSVDRDAMKKSLTGCRVLIVEDSMINQLVLRQILEHVGVDVTAANNGREALIVMTCEGNQFDLVLMDLHMPELDGYEATRILRQEWSADQLPIIAVTADALQEDRLHCLQMGMNDHLAKPVDQDLLYVCLLNWLKNAPISRGQV
jgi:two-component system, sensor histidine kinase and response regulator